MRDVLHQKLVDALAARPPVLTRRDIRLPAVQNKALAVIGIRRSGKKTFLWQCLAERLAAGAPREDLVCVSFEDDRLVGIQAPNLTWMVEEYYRLQPSARDNRTVTFCFDEIQMTPGWEAFARRLLDILQ
jgi:predicted AAA+ superfamily ATPase